VGPAVTNCMLDMNDAVRSGAVVLCQDSPDPRWVTHDAAHPVRVKEADGRETAGVHDLPGAAYQSYNRRLQQRSELVTGLFENGICRGLMSCSWTEPRIHLPIDVAKIETLVAMLALIAAPLVH
jgi:hypothetical protein